MKRSNRFYFLKPCSIGCTLLVLLSSCALVDKVKPAADQTQAAVKAYTFAPAAEVELQRRMQFDHPEHWEAAQPAIKSLREMHTAIARILIEKTNTDRVTGLDVFGVYTEATYAWHDLIRIVADSGVDTSGLPDHVYRLVALGFEGADQLIKANEIYHALRTLLITLGRVVGTVVAGKIGI